MKNLRSPVRKIGKLLRRDFACQAERDPSRFKRLVLRLLQAELPPRPGRPHSNHITLAVADLMSKFLHEKGLDDRDHRGSTELFILSHSDANSVYGVMKKILFQ